tara:strand:+ start:88 stop:426 length:339 start_codon:yes stop_codon:yes gene_type:complete
MKWLVVIMFLYTSTAFAQVKKDGISVVQFSAEFVKSSEISLSIFKDYNTQTLYLSKNQKVFQKEKITSLPTIKLFSDGEEIIKIEGGISLKLPENCLETLQGHIDVLLEQRF